MTAVTAVVERVGRPYLIEAVRMLEAGLSTVAGIDGALEAAGYEQGPLRWLDAVGLDVDLALDQFLQQAEPMTARFDPPPLQLRLVAEGRLGRAAGRGFYRYDTAAAPPVPDVEVDVGELLTPAAIVERLELGMVNEAYRVVEDGLAAPPAIDALMLEAGFPRGPFAIVDALGLRAIIDRLHTLEALTEEHSGDQYEVANVLWQMATV
jgi:3-hydroxyacyl-CoA dehydrogenase